MGTSLFAQERYLEIYKNNVLTHTISLADITEIQIGENINNGYTYVDLGLSVLWATCNVGAVSPEGAGDFYAWGEIATKTQYATTNCTTKGKSITDYAGNPTYDVATKLWGGTWRTPTHAEMQELVNNCTWAWETINGINGYTITSKKNSNSIFLPAAGYMKTEGTVDGLQDANALGRYWTSTPYDGSDANLAHAYYLSFQNQNSYTPDTYYNRYCGRSIRPVMTSNTTENPTNYTTMNISLPEKEQGDYVWLEDMGKITFPNNLKMNIAFTTEASDISYDISQLGTMTFQVTSDNQNDGTTTQAEETDQANQITLRHDNQMLTLESQNNLESVRIFNVHGQLIGQSHPANQYATISIIDLPAGVYFIHATDTSKTQTYKIIKH